jgi:hypothetical protein
MHLIDEAKVSGFYWELYGRWFGITASFSGTKTSLLFLHHAVSFSGTKTLLLFSHHA